MVPWCWFCSCARHIAYRQCANLAMQAKGGRATALLRTLSSTTAGSGSSGEATSTAATTTDAATNKAVQPPLVFSQKWTQETFPAAFKTPVVWPTLPQPSGGDIVAAAANSSAYLCYEDGCCLSTKGLLSPNTMLYFYRV